MASNVESIAELFDTIKKTMSGSDEAKENYAIGYCKGLMAAYIPEDIIQWHINNLRSRT